MDLSSACDLGGLRARFACVAARWALDAPSAARLLGLEGDWTARPLLEISTAIDREGERRMRLACDVDALLWRLVPDALVADWLRETGVGYEDHTITPLQALSTGASALRSLREYLEGLPSAPDTRS